MILNETFQGKAIIEEISREKLPPGVLCRVSYPICNLGKRNANNRVYEAAVWEKVLADVAIRESMQKRCLFGHAEHPEQTQSNLEKTCHVITDMWESDGRIWQKFDILDTPTGRIVDCLLRAECQVGCSTRAEGDLEEAEDDEGSYQKVIIDSYAYKTTDFTADPSTQESIPHDIKRNIVSEVRGLLESNSADNSEKEFAQLILEAIQCKDKGCVLDKTKELVEKVEEKTMEELKKSRQYIMEGTWALPHTVEKAKQLANLIKDPSTFVNLHTKMWNLYGTDMLYDDLDNLQEDILPQAVGIVKKHLKDTLEIYAKDPESFSTPFDSTAIDVLQGILVEQKIVSSLLKEGVIKEGIEVKYGDKDAKVDKIEESKVTLLVGEIDPTTVAVDGNVHVNINPAGLITILPQEVINDVDSTDVNLPATDSAVEPVEEDPVPEEDSILEEDPIPEEDLMDDPDNPGNTGSGMPAVDIEDEIPESKKDSNKKSKSDKKYTEEEQLKRRKADAAAIKSISLESKKHKVGDVVTIVEGEHKDKQGKINKIDETGITVALDDGTTVNIEDPTAVNITVTPPTPKEEIKPIEPEEEFPGAAEEEVADIEAEAVEDELGEAKVAAKGGVSDRLADGNLLQDKDGTHWVVTELTNAGLLIAQPGEAGTEKSLGWDEVPNWSFTKLSEKIEIVLEVLKDEIVSFVVDDERNKEPEDWDNYISELIGRYGFDKVYAAYKLGVDADELSSDGLEKVKGFRESAEESISTTVKEIKYLKIQEALSRVERDKAVELLEELTNEKQKFEVKVTKNKILEIKMLVNRMKQTLEVKEKEVDVLRFKLEEKVKFVAEQKKLVSETRSTSLKGITNLTESIAVEAKSIKAGWQKSDKKYEKQLKQVNEALLSAEKNYASTLKGLKNQHQEDMDKATKEITEKVTKEITVGFIKRFVEFRLSESGLKVDENSRALLENCTLMEDVDNLLDEICDVSRRSALHSDTIRGIHIPIHKVSDPERDRIKRSVYSVFEGING